MEYEFKRIQLPRNIFVPPVHVSTWSIFFWRNLFSISWFTYWGPNRFPNNGSRTTNTSRSIADAIRR